MFPYEETWLPACMTLTWVPDDSCQQMYGYLKIMMMATFVLKFTVYYLPTLELLDE